MKLQYELEAYFLSAIYESICKTMPNTIVFNRSDLDNSDIDISNLLKLFIANIIISKNHTCFHEDYDTLQEVIVSDEITIMLCFYYTKKEVKIYGYIK